MKLVVVRFYWNFNTMIWHLYVFILATWKNFPITEYFSRAKKRKNKAIFRNFETSVNLYEIFYVMKVVGKIRVAIFHIGRIVYFHFRLFLEFSDYWMLRYWRFKKHRLFWNLANFTPKSKVRNSKIGPNYSLRLPQL